MTRPTVLVVGAGYAGRAVAELLGAHVDVTVITERDAFLHNVAALRAVAVEGWAEKVMIPYTNAFDHATVRQATVVGVGDGSVTLADATVLLADYVVIATGSSYPFPGKPTETATGAVFARYARARESIAAARNVVVVGAGPVGIELAGEIATAHPSAAVTLIGDGEDVLPGPYKSSLRRRVRTNLTAAGVELVLGDAPVGPLNGDEIGRPVGSGPLLLRSGRTVAADVVLAAHGARPRTEALDGLRDAIDERGRVRVDEYLRVVGHPLLLAVGDVTDTDEPKQAVAAERHAKIAAMTIRALAAGHAPSRAYRPARVHPIVLPQGPRNGASQLPVGGGLVVGRRPTRLIKGGSLFVPRYRRLLRARP